jgi:hypothetical protein
MMISKFVGFLLGLKSLPGRNWCILEHLEHHDLLLIKSNLEQNSKIVKVFLCFFGSGLAVFAGKGP